LPAYRFVLKLIVDSCLTNNSKKNSKWKVSSQTKSCQLPQFLEKISPMEGIGTLHTGREEPAYRRQMEVITNYDILLAERVRKENVCVFDQDLEFNGTSLLQNESSLDGVVNDKEFNLFPQLENFDNSNFFENFTDIDGFIDAIDNKNNNSIPDFLDLYELDKTDTISDEVNEATKLLTKDEDEFANFVISSLDFDNSNVVSPPVISQNEMEELFGLTGVAHSAILADSASNKNSEVLGNQISDPNMTATTYLENESATSSPDIDDSAIDFLLSSGLTQIVEKNDNQIVVPLVETPESIVRNNETSVVNEQVISSSALKNSELSEEVLNEFVELLNSLDDNSFEVVVAESETVVDSDNNIQNNAIHNCTMNNFLISFDSNTSLSNELSKISSSVNNQSDIDSNTYNIKNSKLLKRKHSSVASDESNIPSPSSSINSDVEFDDIDKTVHRRIKNNEASKVTRAKRRCRNKDLYEKEQELVKSNNDLKIKVEVMQKEADLLRSLLVNALSGCKQQQ